MKYKDLLDALQKLTPAQLELEAQAVKPSMGDAVHECLPIIVVDTVAALEFRKIRSTHNNKYCVEDVVLLLDSNPFAEDGATLYEWDLEQEGDAQWIPIYGEGGKTPVEDQQSEVQAPAVLSRYVLEQVNNRVKQIRGDARGQDATE